MSGTMPSCLLQFTPHLGETGNKHKVLFCFEGSFTEKKFRSYSLERISKGGQQRDRRRLSSKALTATILIRVPQLSTVDFSRPARLLVLTEKHSVGEMRLLR